MQLKGNGGLNMKKLFGILLAIVMMCSVLTATAFADGYDGTVVSPEKNNTEVDPSPVSPQTGYSVGAAGVAVIALACGAVAIVSVKKAHE